MLKFLMTFAIVFLSLVTIIAIATAFSISENLLQSLSVIAVIVFSGFLVFTQIQTLRGN